MVISRVSVFLSLSPSKMLLMDQFEVDIDYFLEDEYFVQWVLHPDENSNRYWENWISSHSEQAEVMTMARQVVLSIQYKNTYKLADEEQRALLENLLTQQGRLERKGDFHHHIPSQRYGTSKIAATFLLITMLAYGMWAVIKESKEQVKSESDYQAAVIEKTSPKGQKLTIKLPDGSVVKLNAGSSVRYPQEFAGHERNVSLQGEAFFDVVENPNKPFVISTDGLETKVLGTSFNVRSYQDEAEIKVAVVTGKVKISGPDGKSSVLLPSEMGIFEREKASITKDQYDFRKEISWKDGVLYFDKDDLKTVIKKLEMWYGVNFEVEKDFRFKGLYSGEFRNNESLEVVLEGISFTSGFDYQLDGDTIMLTKNKSYDE